MKLRTDFVTNSSSASFVSYTCTDERLNRFLLEQLGNTAQDSVEIAGPLLAGGVDTGFFLRADLLDITDYRHDISSDKNHMESFTDALAYYLPDALVQDTSFQASLQPLLQEAASQIVRKDFIDTSD